MPRDNTKFDNTLSEIIESLELFQEDGSGKKGHYSKWMDQRGRKVYPGVLSMKEMKKVLGRKLGKFQKNGKLYALPLIPTRGRIQKEFKKYYTKSFLARPFK